MIKLLLLAVALFPPSQSVLPGPKFEGTVRVESEFGRTGEIAQDARGIRVSWDKEKASWAEWVQPGDPLLFWWEPESYRSYCRHEAHEASAKTECFTWTGEHFVRQLIEWTPEDGWHTTEMESIEILE